MRPPLYHLQDMLDAFRRKKTLTKQELLQAAGCSAMTVWRLLAKHGYFTSYNDNARHYTVVGVPQFDENGLWVYRNARFSKWGALTKTVVGLVEQSPAGLTSRQLEQTLKIANVKPTLTRLIERDSLTRERIGGRFVYFPARSEARVEQQKRREVDAAQTHAERTLPGLEQIVALLVEIIRHPEQTPRQWARRLARQGVRMGTGDIQAVLDHYELDPKKGLLKF